jgi:hypothetical protein
MPARMACRRPARDRPRRRLTRITFCVRGVGSPVLANIYLHYVLDLWFHRRVAKRCRAEACLIRYADPLATCAICTCPGHRPHQRRQGAPGIRVSARGRAPRHFLQGQASRRLRRPPGRHPGGAGGPHRLRPSSGPPPGGPSPPPFVRAAWKGGWENHHSVPEVVRGFRHKACPGCPSGATRGSG